MLRCLINRKKGQCFRHFAAKTATENTAAGPAAAAANSTSGRRKQPLGALAKRPDPHEINCDYIGPPDSISNIRPYVRHIRKNETDLEKRFRLEQIAVEKWNHDFWTRHNKRFFEEKADFIRLHNVAGVDDISADRMSVFYKQFLDKNRRVHFLYNISWYIKNFSLLTMALQVNFLKLFRLFKRKTITDTAIETEIEQKTKQRNDDKINLNKISIINDNNDTNDTNDTKKKL